MHKRCREIMDELILNGELEEITWFKFAPKQELKLRLKDMLEDEVDEKYLLNQELVSKYLETGTASNHKGSQAGKVADENAETFWTVNAGTHGYSMGYVKTINPVCVDANKRESKESTGTITATYGNGVESYGSRPFIRLDRSHTLNIKGNDSIKRIYSSDGLCPSLTTMQGGHREPKVSIEDEYIFRKLTPRECFRLQGFNDSFIFPPKISSTQLYKQAGNGMSRNILDMIFTQIFKSKNFDLSSNS